MSLTNEQVANDPALHLAADEAKVLRGAAEFTTVYVATKALNIQNAKSLMLYVTIDGDTITDSQMKIEFSYDKTRWFGLVHLDIVAAANPNVFITVFELGGTDALLAMPIVNPGAAWMRCQFKANAASGSVALVVGRGQSSGTNPMVNGS